MLIKINTLNDFIEYFTTNKDSTYYLTYKELETVYNYIEEHQNESDVAPFDSNIDIYLFHQDITSE